MDSADIWNDYYTEAVFYAAVKKNDRKKHLDIPEDYVTENGLELGRWYREQKELFQEGRLAEERAEKLDRIHIQWSDNPHKDMKKWNEHYAELRRYKEENHTLSISGAYREKNGSGLFYWLHHQKAMYRGKELSRYQIGKLEELGIEWIRPRQKKTSADRWGTAYDMAAEYFGEHEHLLMERYYQTSDGFHLGSWVAEQRDLYLGIGTGTLTDEKIEKLEAIGMCWESPVRARWSWFLRMLSEYMDSTEQPFPISRDFKYRNYELGRELLKIMRDYVNRTLPREKIQDMKRIGFQFKKGLFVKKGS